MVCGRALMGCFWFFNKFQSFTGFANRSQQGRSLPVETAGETTHDPCCVFCFAQTNKKKERSSYKWQGSTDRREWAWFVCSERGPKVSVCLNKRAREKKKVSKEKASPAVAPCYSTAVSLEAQHLNKQWAKAKKTAESTPSHHVIHFLLFAVSSVILPQGSHQNHGDQADQKNDHHERVEDGEPVDLRNRKEFTGTIYTQPANRSH